MWLSKSTTPSHFLSSTAKSLPVGALAVLEALRRRDLELVVPAKLRLVPWLKLLWPGLLRRKVRGKISGQGDAE